jgi:hypothetical protein
MDKVSKQDAVYFTAAEVGGPDLGTRCGKCRDFISLSSECVILTDPVVSGARGTCVFYIHGSPLAAGRPRHLISKQTAGYIEGRDVPTYCGRCEYYGGNRHDGPCEKVEGDVDYGGCCNLYHAGH